MVKHTFRNKRKHKKTLKRSSQKRKFTIMNPLNGNKYIVYPFKKLWGGENVTVNAFTYDNKNKIDKGAFGTLYKATKEGDDKEFAIKVIVENKTKKYEQAINEAINESKILNYIKSYNNNCRESILCIEDSFTNNNKYYIVTELLDSTQYKNLYHLAEFENGINSFILMFSNICKTINEIHKLYIAHRDIKPENIMVNIKTYNIKIIDFGLACLVNSTDIGNCEYKAVGTVDYIDPLLQLTKDNPNKTLLINLQKSDLWSLGIILFEYIARNSIDYSELIKMLSSDNHINSINEFGKNNNKEILSTPYDKLSSIKDNISNTTSDNILNFYKNKFHLYINKFMNPNIDMSQLYNYDYFKNVILNANLLYRYTINTYPTYYTAKILDLLSYYPNDRKIYIPKTNNSVDNIDE
jgi:serine/threonine protein kinase